MPIEVALPGQTHADALAVPIAQPPTGEGVRIVDEKLGGRLTKLIESGELRGDRGEALVLHVDGELDAARVIAVGVGKRDEVDLDALRTAGAAAAHELRRVGGTLCWVLDESLELPVEQQAAALVEGTVIGGYSPGGWKTQEPEKRPKPVEKIVIGHFDSPELRAAAERAALLAERTNRARDLANMPPNELNPHTLGERAKELAQEHEHLTCEVLGDARARRAADGRAQRRRSRLAQRAAADRPALRPAGRSRRRRARARRQVDHLRHRRDLAEVGAGRWRT